jgi:hypothetical protein
VVGSAQIAFHACFMFPWLADFGRVPGSRAATFFWLNRSGSRKYGMALFCSPINQVESIVSSVLFLLFVSFSVSFMFFLFSNFLFFLFPNLF